MAYNELDPYGTGINIGIAGLGGVSSRDFSLSHQILSDPAYRRKLVSQMIVWLSAHRGSRERPTHTYDELLQGALEIACEKTVVDSSESTGRRNLTVHEQAQMVASRLQSLEQRARNELFKDMQANLKVNVTDGDHVAYRASHPGLFTREDLAAYLRQFTHGIPADELADAYEGVKADIEALIANGTLYEIKHLEKNKSILFPYLRDVDMRVDDDLRDMWHSVQMPKSMVELEARLHSAGHLTDAQYKGGHIEKSRQMQAEIKLAAGQKLLSQAERRAKRKRYPTKLTNTHLIGQFDWLVAPGTKPAAAAASK